jgi:SH3-like domain-containing protein
MINIRKITLKSCLFFMAISFSAPLLASGQNYGGQNYGGQNSSGLRPQVISLDGITKPDNPLSYFRSLTSNTVNVRTGPGKKYPIKWVFKKSGLPLEVIARFHEKYTKRTWLKVRDYEGAEGWVWEKLMRKRRTALIMAQKQALFKYPRGGSKVIAYAQKNVIGNILECEKGWCEIEIKSYKGWLPQNTIWGSFEDEKID